MKKLLIFLFALGTLLMPTITSAQGYNRAAIKTIWGKRVMPSKVDIDSTWNSIPTFIDNGYAANVDSFMLANVGTFAWQDTVAATRYTHSTNVRDTSRWGTPFLLPATYFRANAAGADSQVVCYSNWFRYTPGVNFPAPSTFKIQGWVYMTDTLSTVKFTIYGQNFQSVKIHASAINSWVSFSATFPDGFTYTKKEDIYFTMRLLLSDQATSKIYFNGIKLKAY